ncbi:hypothetical protein BVRB_6g136950 [Beta vulgaris subsp. vulgaris]|nr:hypothetical protein BVRB_6g136950 [Beta vulgaris subsp. vulgaris]
MIDYFHSCNSNIEEKEGIINLQRQRSVTQSATLTGLQHFCLEFGQL